MLKLCIVLLALVTQDCSSQEEEDGPYRGKFIGKLNSYHHQVSGDVYAVDEWTLLLVNFNYDGTGDDTFFWAGDSGRPGPQGFIVPDQHGKTNILERYYNAEVRLRLPAAKRVSRTRWLAVYDIGSQNTFGDVFVPDELAAPAPAAGPALAGPGLASRPVSFLTAATLLVPELRYDGTGEVYLWAGVGPQPSAKGFIVPDEDGYLEQLRAYDGEDLLVELPGGKTWFEVSWLSLWDRARGESRAAVLVPEGLNVPPAARPALPHRPGLPACRQLHRDLQLSWEVFGPQVTFELAGQIAEDEYMALGIAGSSDSSDSSGSSNSSNSADSADSSGMLGADVAVVSYSSRERRGLAVDYNVTAYSPCHRVLDRWAGVCRDTVLGGQDSNQVFQAKREDGLTVVSYRRTLQAGEPMDREWPAEGAARVVWAVGRLDARGEPAYHRLRPRGALRLRLAAPPPESDCFPFTAGERAPPAAWERAQPFDPALRTFEFLVGPSGGPRGLAGRRGPPAAPLAWYVNGQLAPDLQLRRGLAYELRVRGGDDPRAAAAYHPLVLAAPGAGPGARALAGLAVSRRGRPAPGAAGPRCGPARRPAADARRDARHRSFRAYNRSLLWAPCAAAPALLAVTPDSSWPDLVYYDSFTHPGMGGRIFVVDRYRRNLGRATSAAATTAAAVTAVTAATTAAAVTAVLVAAALAL